MVTRSRPRQWLVPFFLAFLVLTPWFVVILGVPHVPVSSLGSGALIGRGGTAPDFAGEELRQPRTDSRADVGRYSPLTHLDPHNHLHMFILLPALAGMVTLGGSLVASALLIRRRTAGPPRDRVVWWQYGLLGLLWWLALSLFLILDLAGSVSLYLGFTFVYALFWVPVGLVILYPRPIREKLLVVILLAAVLFSIRLIDWNTRKPFLKDLARVRLGTPVAQADELMGDYVKSGGTLTQADEQGRIVSGTIAYRHTTEGWGNSDAGVLTIAGGRVVGVQYLPD
jgi:hypothetical protein